MKEIRTIWWRIENSDKFDKAVNESLKDGWELVRRDIFRPQAEDTYSVFLYAEMEREAGKKP